MAAVDRDKIVTVRLSDDEHEKLGTIAQRKGRSASDVLRELLAAAVVPFGEDQPSDAFVGQYERAAAAACAFELRARMLADNVVVLNRYRGVDLEPLLKAIATTLAADFDASGAAKFVAMAKLRNKLLHVDLTSARDRVERHTGAKLARGRVHKVDLAKGGKPVRVSDTSTEGGSVFGWLFEGGLSGMFSGAEGLFRQEIETLNRLMTKYNV
jgi:plasmid stability protein